MPLFYSALHLMHACFDRDQLPPDQRHPELHKSHRDANGQILKWGVLDVVRVHYSATVSTAYSSLYTASVATRYKQAPGGDCSRLWVDYEAISTFAS